MNHIKTIMLMGLLGLGASRMAHADDAAVPPAAPAPAATTATAEVKVGTGMANHEISGEAATFAPGTTVWVWSRIHDGEPGVKHVWKQDGKEVWSATLGVGSKLWSTSSRRTLKAGSYTVDVTTSDGAPLGTVSFTVQ